MRDPVDARADVGDDVELLVQLASQPLGMGLGRMHLAAGELPPAFEVPALGPQCQQERIVSFDDRRDHDDWRCRCRWLHFGACGPTPTGWVQATEPFDSTILART